MSGLGTLQKRRSASVEQTLVKVLDFWLWDLGTPVVFLFSEFFFESVAAEEAEGGLVGRLTAQGHVPEFLLLGEIENRP
jgi:hypothetical protein